MRILLTGASGFIGSYLARKLNGIHYELIRISKTRKGFIKCDITNKKEVMEFIFKNKIGIIIHLAPHIPINKNDRKKTYETNVTGTKNILEAAEKSKIKGLIYVSSMGVYGKPKSIPIKETQKPQPIDYYGLTKLKAEKLCERFSKKFNIIILRYAGVYGYGKNKGAVYNFVLNALLNKPLVIKAVGGKTHDFVYVKDVVNATVLALKNIKKIKFGIFNIGSGKDVAVEELAKIIIKLCDSKSKLIVTQKTVSERFLLDISKAKDLLNYEPQPLVKNLKDYIRMIKWKKYH